MPLCVKAPAEVQLTPADGNPGDGTAESGHSQQFDEQTFRIERLEHQSDPTARDREDRGVLRHSEAIGSSEPRRRQSLLSERVHCSRAAVEAGIRARYGGGQDDE